MSVELEDRGRALENDYFRRREQELIEKMKAKISADNAQAGELICPKCDGKLVETEYENIKIDVCNSCTGVWLDAGELAQIVDKDENNGWFGRMFR
ncbi:MAG: zf-TFIIB domain-containing protein [Acidobacteriota bacterium]|nr:zf-TFIIB domain-containing protein [Acidobacteriota bacterium]